MSDRLKLPHVCGTQVLGLFPGTRGIDDVLNVSRWRGCHRNPRRRHRRMALAKRQHSSAVRFNQHIVSARNNNAANHPHDEAALNHTVHAAHQHAHDDVDVDADQRHHSPIDRHPIATKFDNYRKPGNGTERRIGNVGRCDHFHERPVADYTKQWSSH